MTQFFIKKKGESTIADSGDQSRRPMGSTVERGGGLRSSSRRKNPMDQERDDVSGTSDEDSSH